MKSIVARLKIPWWVVVAGCLSLMVFLAGILLALYFPPFFESPVGSFTASILAAIGGIGLGSVLASYIITLYWEHVRLSKLAQQRIPYLRGLQTSLRLTVSAFCIEFKCPFIDLDKLRNKDLSVIDGRENEIGEWFRGIRNGASLENPSVKGINECLHYISDFYLRSLLDRIGAISYLFEDEPSIRDDFFNIEHNITQAKAYFYMIMRAKAPVPPEGQIMLGDIAYQVVGLLERVKVAAGTE